MESPVGKPYLFYIYPFTLREVYSRGEPAALQRMINKSSLVIDGYLSDDPSPSSELLRVLSIVDAEVYSQHYRQIRGFYRLFIGTWLAKISLIDVIADIVLTFHSDGWGTALVILKPTKDCTYTEALTLMKTMQTLSNPTFVPSGQEQGSPISEYALLELLATCLHELRATNVVSAIRPARSREVIQLGDEYPFVVIHSKTLGISDIGQYIGQNVRNLYGLATIDYWGWRRTREEIALDLFSEDLSRREEYSFFITPQASLEIDSLARFKLIEEWADSTSTSSDWVHLKLLFERVLVLETLRAQHHLMMTLDLEISRAATSQKANPRAISNLRTRIAQGLNDFYNIRTQDKGHIVGVGWIDYGQHCMGILRLHDSLKERIESLEMQYDIVLKSVEYQVTAVLSLISVLLAATASSQVVNMIAEIPSVQASSFNSWKWLVSLGLFLILAVFSGLVFARATRALQSQ